jgi:hypothetical protein
MTIKNKDQMIIHDFVFDDVIIATSNTTAISTLKIVVAIKYLVQ